MEYTRESVKLFIWKSQTKASRGAGWPFHIILNRNIEPVNRGYAEQVFLTSKIKELPD